MDTSSQLLVAFLLATFVADSKAYNCSDVSCPHGTHPAGGASAIPCPEDSHRPIVSHLLNGKPSVGADECCLASCICKSPCPSPPTNCPANSPARVLKPATGSPGSCCPKYHCASPDHEDNLPGEPPALALHSHHSSGSVWESSPDGCVSETGEIMKNGQHWQKDPCTPCRCEAGKIRCTAYMCKVSCSNPRHDPEECCPICDSASVVTLPPHCPSWANCSLRCREGFVEGKDGCFLCQCKSEECKLDCPHGYSEDNFGKKLCKCAESSLPPDCPFLTSCKKNCTHGLRTNRNGCSVCKCNKCKQMVFSSIPNTDVSSEGTILESTSHGVMLLCAGPCQYGYVKDDRGCPTCRCDDPPNQPEEITTIYSEDITSVASSCISSDGKEMAPNDVWWDGCRKCHCFQGLESCATFSCPPVQSECDSQITNQEKCCPDCTEIKRHLFCLLVFGFLILIVIVLIMIWKMCPRRQRRMFSCSREKEEDGSDVRLEVSPSPSPTCSPTQSNGTSKVSRYLKDKCLSSHEVGMQEPFRNGTKNIIVDCCT